jgi:hypothetical protein
MSNKLSTFKAIFEDSVDGWKEAVEGEPQVTEWWELKPEEEFVFDIDRQRYPRMAALWHAYEVLKTIGEDDRFPDDVCHAVRDHLGFAPLTDDIRIDPRELTNLAIYLGLNMREAHQMMAKIEAWQLRVGILAFQDEEDGPGQPN